MTIIWHSWLRLFLGVKLIEAIHTHQGDDYRRPHQALLSKCNEISSIHQIINRKISRLVHGDYSMSYQYQTFV